MTMHKDLLRSLCLASLLLLVPTGCSKGDDNGATTTTKSSKMTPEQAYARHCALCHGQEGKGDGPLGKEYGNTADLSSERVQDAHSDEEFGNIIRKGFDKMPPVRGLSQADIDQVVIHVRHLGGRDAAPAEQND